MANNWLFHFPQMPHLAPFYLSEPRAVERVWSNSSVSWQRAKGGRSPDCGGSGVHSVNRGGKRMTLGDSVAARSNYRRPTYFTVIFLM